MAKGTGRSGEAHGYPTLAQALRALNGPIRSEILVLLVSGERDVSSISAALDLDIATVSHNLSMLRQRGLVQRRQDHKRHIYAHSACIRSAVTDTHVEVTVMATGGCSVTIRK